MPKEKKPTPQTDLEDAHYAIRDTSPFSIDRIRSGTTGSLVTKIIMGLMVLVFAVGFLFMDPSLFGGGGRRRR